jgi:hypothetical protein
MTELVVRLMVEDDFEPEIHAVGELLLLAGISTVYVTYGFGCEREAVIQGEEIAVSTDHLAQFILDSEAMGLFELGANDLHIRSGTGHIEFLLCHEHDIHFQGEETRLLRQVRSRWSRRYGHCYERRSGGEWRLISVANSHGDSY